MYLLQTGTNWPRVSRLNLKWVNSKPVIIKKLVKFFFGLSLAELLWKVKQILIGLDCTDQFTFGLEKMRPLTLESL